MAEFSGIISITNSKFQVNSAIGVGGGGVVLDGSRGNVNITNSTFQNNSALRDGGAIQVSMGIVIITNCTFQNNSASGDLGGAMSLDMLLGIVNVIITNCKFHYNWRFGGAMSLHT